MNTNPGLHLLTGVTRVHHPHAVDGIFKVVLDCVEQQQKQKQRKAKEEKEKEEQEGKEDKEGKEKAEKEEEEEEGWAGCKDTGHWELLHVGEPQPHPPYPSPPSLLERSLERLRAQAQPPPV